MKQWTTDDAERVSIHLFTATTRRKAGTVCTARCFTKRYHDDPPFLSGFEVSKPGMVTQCGTVKVKRSLELIGQPCRFKSCYLHFESLNAQVAFGAFLLLLRSLKIVSP